MQWVRTLVPMAVGLLWLGQAAGSLRDRTPLQPQRRERSSRAISTGALRASAKDPQERSARHLSVPLSFEANRGQFDQAVEFVARGDGYSLALAGGDATLCLQHRAAVPPVDAPRLANSRPAVLEVKLLHARPGASAIPEAQLPGRVNYFLGSDPARWRTGISTYERIRYREIYPGVDLAYYGSQQQLEYDFIVRPGADPNRIRFAVAGAQSLELSPGGDLVLKTDGGEVVQHAPVIYQEFAGLRKPIQGGYVLAGSSQVGFRLGEYDDQRPLIIDPVLSYSTYLGGSSTESSGGIAVDSAGSAYVVGVTNSTNLPLLNPLQATNRGTQDVFISKLNPAGDALVYSTYLGGSVQDFGVGIAVDGAGAAYVTGFTNSTDFPTRNPIQPANLGGYDSFVLKLSPAGSALVYSTYLGSSSNDDHAAGIAVDGAGEAYVTGWTSGPDFPTRNALQPDLKGSYDAYLTKLNAAGSALDFSTYLGGSAYDLGRAIALDAAGNVYVSGKSQSLDFPVANAFQRNISADQNDAFVAKLTPSGGALIYATFLGGNNDDDATGIAADVDGNAIVVGDTFSTNFPTHNALQAAPGGSGDVFVTKLNPGGSSLLYSTYLGGTDFDETFSVAVDQFGNAYISGDTESPDFPLVGSNQGFGGIADVFIAQLPPAGDALVYSTFLGGSGYELALGTAVDNLGSAYVVGQTVSFNFPTVAPFQAANHGGFDAFVAKLGPAGPPVSGATHFALVAPATVVAGEPFNFTLTALDTANNPFPGYLGTVHFTSTDLKALLPPDYTFTAADNGVHVFNVTLKTAGAQTLTAADTAKPSLRGSTPVTVTAGAAAKLLFGQQPTHTPVDTPITPPVTVRIVDEFDNLVTTAVSRVTLALGSNPTGATLGGTTSTPAVNGIANFGTLTLDKVGDGYTLAPSTADLPGPFTPSAPFNVTSRPVTRFAVAAPASVSSGIPFEVTVTALDASNQPVATYEGSVHWTSNDPQALLPADYTFTAADAGVHRFTVTLKTLGSKSITVTDKANSPVTGTATFTVTEAVSLVVTTIADTVSAADGATSLREAILAANARAGLDTISFKIPGSGVKTITPLTPLPKCTDPVVIDGYTQGTARPNTLISGTNALLQVEIRGSSAGRGANGLTLSGGASSVRGLIINRFQAVAGAVGAAGGGAAVRLEGAGGSRVTGCFLGVTSTGKTAAGNYIGVLVEGSADNVLGGSGAAVNLISANTLGVYLHGDQASGNRVESSLIGTTSTGATALGNFMGVRVEDALENAIGPGNVISGNIQSNGVQILGTAAARNVVQGNRIGVSANGASALANGFGVVIARASDNVVGGATPAARNIISGNVTAGVTIYGTSASQDIVERNRVQGNYIGTDGAGARSLPNGVGIQLQAGAQDTLIGGDAPGEGNVISGNKQSGVVIADGGNRVQGNYIGLEATGTKALGNGKPGNQLDSGIILRAAGNVVGGVTPGARNVISGNANHGVFLDAAAATGNVIQGNYVGTNAAGTAAVPQTNGVSVAYGSGNVVGGVTAGAGNLISGNSGNGVLLLSANGNFIQGNLIGTRPGGTAALPNRTGMVIIAGSMNNVVGGLTPSARNLISGNTTDGLAFSDRAAANQVEGNYIGTTASGVNPLPNGTSGVIIKKGAGANVIGGATPGAGNVISGNKSVNLSLFETGNLVQGNYIGTDAAGTQAVDRSFGNYGITVWAPGNTIGGTAPGAGNLISGNGDGIGIATSGTQVQGNRIGTDSAGLTAVPNNRGVSESGANNRIGGSQAGAGNLISGNRLYGLDVFGTATLIQGNFIGTNAFGTGSLPNVNTGLRIDSIAKTVIVGGEVAGAGNLISGNGQYGVLVAGSTNKVQGNFAGTNATGTGALPNGIDGIFVTGSNNLIGGATPVVRNLLSGNVNSGVAILGSGSSGSGNVVQGNYIGTDASGTLPIPNNDGVYVAGPKCTVGGTVAGAGNLISGNREAGVVLRQSGAVVQGNLVGSDFTGIAGLPNETGLDIIGAGNLVGGLSPAARNVISGNLGAGVYLDGSGNLLQGNFIGSDVTGALPLPNLNGVFLSDANTQGSNTFGGFGAGAGNRIVYNASHGVLSRGGSRNAFRGNAIFGNGRLGINLFASTDPATGVTPNDSLDKDKGPNALQNYPVLTQATASGNTVTLKGTLHSSAKTRLAVDLYRSVEPDATGWGEGEVYLGSALVTTDSGGNAAFSVALSLGGSGADQYFTATASRDYGSGIFETSEFSQAVPATGP